FGEHTDGVLQFLVPTPARTNANVEMSLTGKPPHQNLPSRDQRLGGILIERVQLSLNCRRDNDGGRSLRKPFYSPSYFVGQGHGRLIEVTPEFPGLASIFLIGF